MALIVKCNFNAHITSFRSVQDMFCWNSNWLPWQFFEKERHNFSDIIIPICSQQKMNLKREIKSSKVLCHVFQIVSCIYLQENRYFTFVSQLVSMQICWNDNIYHFGMHIHFVFVFRYNHDFANPKYV